MQDHHRLVAVPRGKSAKLSIEGDNMGVLQDCSGQKLFYVPTAGILGGLVQTIVAELKDLVTAGHATADEISKKKELYELASGEAVSLDLAHRFDRSMELLNAHGSKAIKAALQVLPHDPNIALTPAFVNDSLSEKGYIPPFGKTLYPYRVPTFGIVPALFVPQANGLKRLFEKSNLSQRNFSKAIFGDIYEDAYEEVMYGKGNVRLTIHTTLRVSRRAAERLGKKSGLSTEDFSPETLFRISANVKRSERALSPKEGNQVPGRSEYKALAK